MALTQTPEEGLKVSNAPSDGKFLQYKDSTDKLTWATAADGTMSNLVEDTTPQLGGNLDVQDKVITTDTGTDTHITIKPKGAGQLAVGPGDDEGAISANGTYNLRLKANAAGASGANINLISGNNGGIDITPVGTGGVQVSQGKFKVAGNATEAHVTAHGTSHLKLNTNEGTNSGEIEIEDGADNDIKITPNGTGDVIIDGLKYPQADGSAGQFLKTDGSAQLSWATVSSTPEGEAILSTTNSNEASTKFLRADGDGTCSWQIPPAATTTSGTNSFTVADGDLVIGTAGHGIDFSAGANNAGTTSELLDDYEEGVFTVTSGTTNQTFHSNSDLLAYVKIGSFVYFGGQLRVDDAGDSSHVQLHVNNLPFQNNGGGEGSADGRCAFSTGGMTKDDYNGGANYYDTTWWRSITIGGTTLLNYRSIDTNNKWFYGYVIDDAYVSVTGSYRTND